MAATSIPTAQRPKLHERDFSRISDYIQTNVGIRLPLTKLIMVESRLIKRILKLNLSSFSEYVNYVFGPHGRDERDDLIDFICTNKTDFFREDHHFRFLENHILNARTSQRPVQIWSAACSSGEEPYTTAIVLEEMRSRGFTSHYELTATDISATILDRAKRGVYTQDKYTLIPHQLQKKYFSVSNGLASIDDSIKRNIAFQKFNLIDASSYESIKKQFDYIFCRNVLIYFDQATQLRVVGNLVKKLQPGGILFLGHSETLLGRNTELKQLQPTIYQKGHA